MPSYKENGTLMLPSEANELIKIYMQAPNHKVLFSFMLRGNLPTVECLCVPGLKDQV